MYRLLSVALCFLGVLAVPANAQGSSIEPIHVTAGTVLTFHLQTRLNPTDENAIDVLPKGTVLHVKVLDSIDSSVNRDGSEFRGSLVAPLLAGDDVIIHAEAEVVGILVLLRSSSHPDGFRYELLVTGIKDGGKFYALTASLNPSFADAGSQPTSSSKAGTKENSKDAEPANSKTP
jgi:hypothetical protein